MITTLSPVSLRTISIEDAPRITLLLEGDTELALCTATIPIPYALEDARAFLTASDPRGVFAIAAGNELVGLVGLLPEGEDVEIGYWIGRAYWGRGYATCAVGLLMEEARRRGISHLKAEAFPDNPASMRVLEKSGFHREREVVRDLPKRGGLRQLIRFRADL